jgi:hypothetical protein
MSTHPIPPGSFPALVHAHDSRVHFILDEIRDDILGLSLAVVETGDALGEDTVLADARLRNLAAMKRIHSLAIEVAILRDMLGVR